MVSFKYPGDRDNMYPMAENDLDLSEDTLARLRAHIHAGMSADQFLNDLLDQVHPFGLDGIPTVYDTPEEEATAMAEMDEFFAGFDPEKYRLGIRLQVPRDD